MAKAKPQAKAASLIIKRIALVDLIPHPRNPRRHPLPGSPEWEALKASLESDYYDPIVMNSRNGMLVSGHLRVKVLTESGFIEADCVVVDYDEEMHIARMVSANRGAGEDDLPNLKDLLQELDTGAFDMALAGFTEQALADLMTQFKLPDENKQINEGQMADTKNECPNCSFKW